MATRRHDLLVQVPGGAAYSGGSLNCTPIVCDPPVLPPSAHVAAGCASGSAFGTSCALGCADGYVVTGSSHGTVGCARDVPATHADSLNLVVVAHSAK